MKTELEAVRDKVADRIDAVVHAPSLRGVSHLLACGVAIVGAVYLAIQAAGTMQLAAAIIYGTGLALALGVSGVYHRLRLRPRLGPALRTLDHSMIFVFTATTYTPFLLLADVGGWRVGTMILIWSMALVGIITRLLWTTVPRWVMVCMYISLGWLAVVLMPALRTHLDPTVFVLIVTGGVLYSLGALVYLLQRPNPFPRVFGFHEIFHVFVVAAAACHFAAVWPLVTHTLNA